VAGPGPGGKVEGFRQRLTFVFQRVMERIEQHRDPHAAMDFQRVGQIEVSLLVFNHQARLHPRRQAFHWRTNRSIAAGLSP
jgi:hypothetical protein